MGICAFYALQPYLLQLYGDSAACGIAGLAAPLIAAAQIVGGLFVPQVRRLFSRRTDALLIGSLVNGVMLVAIGMTGSFWLALVLLAAWAMAFAVEMPQRQAFVNGAIRSEQRATVWSFDNLTWPLRAELSSSRGWVASPMCTATPPRMLSEPPSACWPFRSLCWRDVRTPLPTRLRPPSPPPISSGS